MDYLKRKKEQASPVITGVHMNGFMMSQMWGMVMDTKWRTEAEQEINKLIDQVYSRGLKDGRKG